MAIDAKKIEIKSVSDASGLDEWITSGAVSADQIVAVTRLNCRARHARCNAFEIHHRLPGLIKR